MAAQSSATTAGDAKVEGGGVAPEEIEKLADASEWFIPWERISLGKELGAGAFGVVYRAEYAGLPIAAKKLKGLIAPASVKEEFAQEVETLKKLRHPNIVLFMGITKDPEDNYYILSEFGSNGSMNTFLARNKAQLTWSQKTGYVMEICLALAYLHDNGCLHRDLKAENVLLSHAGVCKVADFGLARTFGRAIALNQQESAGREFIKQTSLEVGSLWWRAPEVEDPTAEYSGKIDVFSLGITVAEIITDGTPGDDLRCEGAVPDPADKLKYSYDSTMLAPLLEKHHPPRALIDIVERCGRIEPALRPNVQELVAVTKRLHELVERVERALVQSVPEFAELALRVIAGLLTWEQLDHDVIVPKKLIYDALSDRLRSKTSCPLSSEAREFLNSDGGSAADFTFTIQSLIVFLQWYQPLESLLLDRLILPLFRTGLISGFTSKTQAESQLSGAPVGAIIVRFSSRPGHFAISYRKTSSETSHALVKATDVGIVSGTVVHKTFGDMLSNKPQYRFVCPDQPLSKWAAIHQQISEEVDPPQQTIDSYEQVSSDVGAASLSRALGEMLVGRSREGEYENYA